MPDNMVKVTDIYWEGERWSVPGTVYFTGTKTIRKTYCSGRVDEKVYSSTWGCDRWCQYDWQDQHYENSCEGYKFRVVESRDIESSYISRDGTTISEFKAYPDGTDIYTYNYTGTCESVENKRIDHPDLTRETWKSKTKCDKITKHVKPRPGGYYEEDTDVDRFEVRDFAPSVIRFNLIQL